MSVRKILVTGGSGTLGYNVVRLLSGDPRNEIFAPLRGLQLSQFEELPSVRVLELDYSNGTELRQVLTSLDPDIIIHCAASGLRPPKADWFEMAGFNVEATLRLFQAACGLKNCHFIYVSTGLVYKQQDRPVTEYDPIGTLHPYGATKAAADSLLQAAAAQFRRKLTVVRPCSFTGLHDGGDRIFPALLRAAQMHQPLELSAGTQIRDFCSVQDIAAGIVATLEYGESDALEIFNLGSGIAATVKQTVQRVCRDLNIAVELRFGAKAYHPGEPMHLVLDIGKATSVLGWKPRVSLPFAVWQLADSQFPDLSVRRPEFHDDLITTRISTDHHASGF